MASQNVTGEHLDLTGRQVRNLIEQGVLPASQPGRGLDIDECRTAYIRHLRAGAAGQRNKPAGTYDEERTRLVSAQADKTELEVKEIRGEVVRMPLIEQHWMGMVSAMRAKLLALPSKAAAAVASPEKLQATTDTIQGFVYEALEEIAGDAIPDEVRVRVDAQRRTGEPDNALANPAKTKQRRAA